MTQLVMPIDWTTMSNGLITWAKSVATSPWSVAWNEQKAPLPRRPFVSLGLLVPPVPDGHAWVELINREEIGVAITVPTDNTVYSITLNGTTVSVNSGTDATANTIRDDIVAAINASPASATATPASIDGVLAVSFPVGDPTVVGTDPEQLLVRALFSATGEATATFQVDCFGRSDADDEGPAERLESVPMSNALYHSLESPDVQELLSTMGWSVISVEGVRKASRVVGTRWEDRSGFDVRLRCSLQRQWLSQYLEDIGTLPEGTLSL